MKKYHEEERIIENKAKCLSCNKVLESMTRHDYKTCGCPNSLMVDGGKDYIRRSYADSSKTEELSKFEIIKVPCSKTDDMTTCWRCDCKIPLVN